MNKLRGQKNQDTQQENGPLSGVVSVRDLNGLLGLMPPHKLDHPIFKRTHSFILNTLGTHTISPELGLTVPARDQTWVKGKNGVTDSYVLKRSI